MGKILSRFKGFTFHDEYMEKYGRYTNKENLLPRRFTIDNDSKNLVNSGWNKGYSITAVPFWCVDKYNGYKYVNPLLGSLSVIFIFLIRYTYV